MILILTFCKFDNFRYLFTREKGNFSNTFSNKVINGFSLKEILRLFEEPFSKFFIIVVKFQRVLNFKIEILLERVNENVIILRFLCKCSYLCGQLCLASGSDVS